jgi:hypothetical protein
VIQQILEIHGGNTKFDRRLPRRRLGSTAQTTRTPLALCWRLGLGKQNSVWLHAGREALMSSSKGFLSNVFGVSFSSIFHELSALSKTIAGIIRLDKGCQFPSRSMLHPKKKTLQCFTKSNLTISLALYQCMCFLTPCSQSIQQSAKSSSLPVSDPSEASVRIQ